MEKFDRFISRIAFILVFGLMAAVPLGIWYYEKVHIPAQYPPGTKVFDIMGYGRNGQWTLGKISGYNYWRGAGGRLQEIVVNKGDTVVIRLNSADVQHSFSISDLKVDAGFIKPGYITEVKFVADKPGAYTFRCREFCSPLHPAMFGRLVVKG